MSGRAIETLPFWLGGREGMVKMSRWVWCVLLGAGMVSLAEAACGCEATRFVCYDEFPSAAAARACASSAPIARRFEATPSQSIITFTPQLIHTLSGLLPL